MTKDEMIRFCITHRGQIVTATVINSTKSISATGRLIGFNFDDPKISKILIEDDKSPLQDFLRSPLQIIPYRNLKYSIYNYVIGNVRCGVACLFNTITWDEIKEKEKPTQAEVIQIPRPAIAVIQKVCRHDECDSSWCHRRYIDPMYKDGRN